MTGIEIDMTLSAAENKVDVLLDLLGEKMSNDKPMEPESITGMFVILTEVKEAMRAVYDQFISDADEKWKAESIKRDVNLVMETMREETPA